LPASAWAAPASAWASFSAVNLAAALRHPSAAQGQFGNLIFGFAITEALGIFSLLGLRCCCCSGSRRRQSWPNRPPIPRRRRVTALFRRSKAQHFPSQLIWLVLSFVLLYVLMSKIALPRIGSILAERSRLIRDDLKAAEALKQQSDAAHAAYEKALADARAARRQSRIRRAKKQVSDAAATQQRLEAQLHDKLAAAEQSIAATRTAAMGNVRGIAADTAAAIVERLIGKAPAAHEVAAALGDSGKS